MEIETILNAMEKSISLVSVMGKQGFETVRYRQYNAFRARILQKYHALELLVQLQNEGLVQRKARIVELEGELDWANGIIEQMVAKLAEKDEEIGDISHYFDYIFEQLEDCRKEITEKDEMIAALSIALDASESGLVEILLAEKDTRIDEYRKEIIEKDEEIRMLEETIREMRGFL